MKNSLVRIVFFIGILALWQVSVPMFHVPSYLIPTPLQIGEQIILKHALLLKHTYITFLEAITGFALGLIIALLFALGITRSKFLDMLISPFMVISQTIPKIAIAPLLLIWFGYGLLPKVVVSAVMCFFPIVVSTVKGLKSVDPELLDLMGSYGATKTETLIKVKIPAALPYIFAALKVSITLSVMGAVVGEFVGADGGLGYLILQSNANLDTSLMFAELVILSMLGLSLFGIIRLIEKKVLSWHTSEINIEQN